MPLEFAFHFCYEGGKVGGVWPQNVVYLSHMNAAHLPPRPTVVPQTTVDATTPIPPGVLITLRFDGACSPNPGPMGIGYTLSIENAYEEPRVLVKVGAQIGQGTNNEAEYQSLLAGMRHALKLGFWSLTVRSDSALVVNQVNGLWKVKDGRLKRLHAEVANLRRLFHTFEISHVYREENRTADGLSHELVFEEPHLPDLPPNTGTRFPRSRHSWQAAAIRVWSLRHHPGSGTLGRIFGLAPAAVEQIADGRSYRDADFSGHDAWIGSLL